MNDPLILMIDQAKHALAQASTINEVEAIRVQFLGKKGLLSNYLQSVGQLPPEERPAAGQAVNLAKQQITDAIASHMDHVTSLALLAKIEKQSLDVTLPGRAHFFGHPHPLILTTRRIEKIFFHLGFDIASGPEIENDYYNFNALNIPDNHPARAMHDTFYLQDNLLLRTHTSTVQIHTMENRKPPLRMIAPGRVFRYESDATHSPMFHQLEGLLVDHDVSFANLKSLLQTFLEAFFEKSLNFRFRPSYFPFTEPSAECDISCTNCDGKGCQGCSQTGWLEILGCGMVHPNVLNAANIDSERYRGLAFGVGIDRMAMLYYNVPDLRLFYENDIRFLEQF